jgi:Zn-dependent protease with chaperone function
MAGPPRGPAKPSLQMDFFAAQDRARAQTRWLVVAFAAAMIVLTVAFYGVFWLVEGLVWGPWDEDYRPSAGAAPAWSLWRLLGVGAGVIGIVGIASLVKISQFRAGGAAVAKSLGGREVDVSTRQPQERRLVNVVEEMAIASGVPVPAIFVLEEEAGINAFAAGYGPEDAAVAVSKGCLESLSRDELQGVIAHEFSHILNGDMRLNLRLAGIIFGLFVLVVLGRGIFHVFRFARVGGGRGKGGAGAVVVAVVIVGVSLFLLGLIGQFFGRLIQAAVSRQREYLADAAAVQFTRHPAGIRDALRRVAGHVEGGRVRHQQVDTLAHCFFVNAFGSSFGGGFRTHPPLPERIRAVDPQWDGTFLSGPARTAQAVERPPPPPSRGARVGRDFATGAVVAMAGATALGQGQLDYARELREGVEGIDAGALSRPEAAEALVLALFIASAGGGSVPWDRLEATLGHPVRASVERWRERKGKTFSRSDHLALLELALPPLLKLDAAAHRRLESAVSLLVSLDGEVTLHEFILAALLQHRFEGAERAEAHRAPTHSHPRSLRGPLERVLSLLAWEAAGRNLKAAEAHFVEAVTPRPAWKDLTFAATERPDFARLDEDLRALPQATLPLKRELLEVARAIILRDERVSESEAGLFRLLVAILGVPCPPLVAEAPEKNRDV